SSPGTRLGADPARPYSEPTLDQEHVTVIIVWIVLAIVVLLAIYVIVTYNGLVSLRNRIENAWAQIDVQLKRRYDLIPNLVETVKGYAAHERQTLEAVINARNLAINAQ